MKLAVESFLCGFVLGAAFGALRLPAPAPNVIAGAIGVVGVTLGFICVHRYRR